MNALVIYYSKFGHTKMLAETMAESLAEDGSARTVCIDEIDATGLTDLDLVVMGSPTHNMNLPVDVRQALDALPKGTLRGAQVAAFDTSYRMNALLERFTAAKRADRKLRQLGGERLVKPETFYVTAAEGPLEKGETARARAWADTLRKQRVEQQQ